MESIHTAASPGAPSKQSAKRRLLKATAVVAVLGLAVGLLIFGNEQPFVYSQPVAAILANPSAFAGQTLRAEGMLVSGSVRFREEPCEWRFALNNRADDIASPLQITFPQCVVPDTFRDGMGISVVVQGTLQGPRNFHATEVIPRCPSKYEMRERQGQGEAMPHALPGLAPTAP